jgi:hypothetical protein
MDALLSAFAVLELPRRSVSAEATNPRLLSGQRDDDVLPHHRSKRTGSDGWRIDASRLADEPSENRHDRTDNRGGPAAPDTISVLTAAQFNAHARKDRADGTQGAAVVHRLCTAAVANGFGA